MTTETRPAVETAAHSLALSVMRCKGSGERFALGFDVYKSATLKVALDVLLERGHVGYGTTNASARAFTKGADQMLYITKAGKAWLRTFGSDFGSSLLVWEALRAAGAAALADRAFVVTR